MGNRVVVVRSTSLTTSCLVAERPWTARSCPLSPFGESQRKDSYGWGEVSLVKETEDRVIPPSDEVITIVDRTINDELKDAARKGKKRFAFDSALPPVKKAKATPSATLPHKMKNPKKVGTGSASAAMDAFVSESMTPSPNHEYQDESDSMQDGDVGTQPTSQRFVILSSDSLIE
ncbi:hypothetical protein Tco_0462337 [Tanacetum coccineum]